MARGRWSITACGAALVVAAASGRAQEVPRGCLATGGAFHLLVAADSTVWTWGFSPRGALGLDVERTSQYDELERPVQVPGVTGAIAVAAGWDHSLALLANGTVLAWGDGVDGQLGNEPDDDAKRSRPLPVEQLPPAVAIAAGGNRSFAILRDGTVRGWGSSALGTLGDGSLLPSLASGAKREYPVRVKNLHDVVQVAVDASRLALALEKDGTVWSWGPGPLGNGTSDRSGVPVQLPGIRNAIGVAVGNDHALVLLGDGTVVGWGKNDRGQLGYAPTRSAGDDPPVLSPRRIPLPRKAVAISAGTDQSFAVLDDGTLAAWGYDEKSALGFGRHGRKTMSPDVVPPVRDVRLISTRSYAATAITSQGDVYTWGAGFNHDREANPSTWALAPRPLAECYRSR